MRRTVHISLSVISILVLSVTSSEAASKRVRPPKPEFSNCTELHAVYPHGVGRSGAADHVRGHTAPVTDFTVDDALYNSLPSRLDRDQDGVACEKQ